MQPSKFCLENLGARDQKTPPISLPMFTGSRGPWWEVRLEILLHATDTWGIELVTDNCLLVTGYWLLVIRYW